MIHFKSEFEANLDLAKLKDENGAQKSLKDIFDSKKYYIEIQMRFKEAAQTEIECQDNLKMHMSLAEAKDDFQTVSTCKLLLRNSTRSGMFHFYPVTFDTGYFSVLPICASSIVKDFKYK